METRKEKIKREIGNFVKVLKEKGDLDGAKLFSSGADTACIEKEMPICVFLSICLNESHRLGITIESGADPNFQDLLGYSALHYAAIHGKRDQIELLLNKTKELGIELDVNL